LNLRSSNRRNTAPEYDLTSPFESDRYGAPHTRRRRETSHSVHFKLFAFGEDYLLEVKHNVDFLTPGFFVQIAGQSKLDFDRIESCHYTGQLKTHSPSHVAVSDCPQYGMVRIKMCQNNVRKLLSLQTPRPECVVDWSHCNQLNTAVAPALA
jgi:hypothetical protein